MLGLLRGLLGAITAKLRPDPAGALADLSPMALDHTTAAARVQPGDRIRLANGEEWEVPRAVE